MKHTYADGVLIFTTEDEQTFVFHVSPGLHRGHDSDEKCTKDCETETEAAFVARYRAEVEALLT